MRLLRAWMRPLTFLLVGGTCFGIQLCILLLLVHIGMAKPIANAIGFASSTQLNFLLSRRLTWADRVAGSTSMLTYYVAALIGLGVNSAAFVAVYRTVGVTVAAVIASLTSAVCNYLLCYNVVFRRRRDDGVSHLSPALGPPHTATAEVTK